MLTDIFWVVHSKTCWKKRNGPRFINGDGASRRGAEYTEYIQYCQMGKHSHTNSSTVTSWSVLSKIILQIGEKYSELFCDWGDCRRRRKLWGLALSQLKCSVCQHWRNCFCQIRMIFMDSNPATTYYADGPISICGVFRDRLLSSMPVKTELRPDINFIQVGTDLISLWYKRLENGDRLKSQRDHLKMKRTELQLD